MSERVGDSIPPRLSALHAPQGRSRARQRPSQARPAIPTSRGARRRRRSRRVGHGELVSQCPQALRPTLCRAQFSLRSPHPRPHTPATNSNRSLCPHSETVADIRPQSVFNFNGTRTSMPIAALHAAFPACTPYRCLGCHDEAHLPELSDGEEEPGSPSPLPPAQMARWSAKSHGCSARPWRS